MKYFILLNLLSLSVMAQPNTLRLEDGVSSPTASLDAARWITGSWVGEGLGGYCEEVWSPIKAGSMFGVFRMIKKDELVFSEFIEIVESDGSILLRLKHYGKDFVGWEEKDESVVFKLVQVTDDALYFDGLTYRKVGNNEMEVYVIINSGSEAKEEKFTYRKLGD